MKTKLKQVKSYFLELPLALKLIFPFLLIYILDIIPNSELIVPSLAIGICFGFLVTTQIFKYQQKARQQQKNQEDKPESEHLETKKNPDQLNKILNELKNSKQKIAQNIVAPDFSIITKPGINLADGTYIIPNILPESGIASASDMKDLILNSVIENMKKNGINVKMLKPAENLNTNYYKPKINRLSNQLLGENKSISFPGYLINYN